MTRMQAVVDGYHRECHELNLDTRLERPWHQMYVDDAARLTSALQ